MTGRWQGSTRRTRLPADWPTRRQRILQRDGWRCTTTDPTTGERCTQPATDVDHRQAGDDHSDANLHALCAKHHRAKSSSEGTQARWRWRDQRPTTKHPGLR